jgi:hypothetical protein
VTKAKNRERTRIKTRRIGKRLEGADRRTSDFVRTYLAIALKIALGSSMPGLEGEQEMDIPSDKYIYFTQPG